MKLFIFCLFLFSLNLKAQDLQYNYAKELYLNEQYSRAVYQFDTLLTMPLLNADRALIGLTASLWMLGDTKAAFSSLNKISDIELSAKLKVALAVSSGDLKVLKSQDFGNMYLTELQKLESDPYKSPGIAALYSMIFPGAGHVYLGAYQSAAIVFAFNLLTGISTVEFANKDLKAPAIASGVLFSIFYVGGIYSSYEGAVKMNQLKINKPKKDLNAKYFPILRLTF
ncbi:MAG: hypothetical protein PHY93_10450 [Bacteriovorax sp.]|nr:hypothetical protein [Bacteriovorax sp.]